MAIFKQDTVHPLHNTGTASWEFGMGSMLQTKKKLYNQTNGPQKDPEREVTLLN